MSKSVKWFNQWNYLNKSHLSNSFFVMIIHLTDQSIAQVNSNSLDGLILSGLLQDFQQQLVDPTVLELQFLWYTEVTQSQAAVPLYLVGDRERTKEGLHINNQNSTTCLNSTKSRSVIWTHLHFVAYFKEILECKILSNAPYLQAFAKDFTKCCSKEHFDHFQPKSYIWPVTKYILFGV